MDLIYMTMALLRRGSGHRHMEGNHEDTGRSSCLQAMEKGFRRTQVWNTSNLQEENSRYLPSKSPEVSPP